MIYKNVLVYPAEALQDVFARDYGYLHIIMQDITVSI